MLFDDTFNHLEISKIPSSNKWKGKRSPRCLKKATMRLQLNFSRTKKPQCLRMDHRHFQKVV